MLLAAVADISSQVCLLALFSINLSNIFNSINLNRFTVIVIIAVYNFAVISAIYILLTGLLEWFSIWWLRYVDAPSSFINISIDNKALIVVFWKFTLLTGFGSAMGCFPLIERKNSLCSFSLVHLKITASNIWKSASFLYAWPYLT